MFFETYRGMFSLNESDEFLQMCHKNVSEKMCQINCCRWIKITFHCVNMFFETYRGTFSLNESVEFLQMNKNHSTLYENGLRDLSRTFSLNESDDILQLTFKACNTDPYVSLTLLHSVVWWKGLVDRVRVPWGMCPLPPGVVHGTKLGDVLCWDFAVLVVLDLSFYHESPSSR